MNKLIPLLLVFLFIFNSCKQEKNVSKNETVNKFDTYIQGLMEVHEIPGMAIAIIKDGEILHKGSYGWTSLAKDKAINEHTIFRLYSLSKLNTTVAIFKLIEENKLSLNDKLSDHFNNFPEKWQNITIRNLLSHSSGLPDIRELTTELGDSSISDENFIKLVFDKEMDFVTGEEWSYNQTNFLLLKALIEKTTNISFEDYVLKTQFASSSSKEVLFSANPFDSIPNRTTYYSFDKETNAYKIKTETPGKRNNPLSGVNITLDEYIAWNERMDGNKLLTSQTKDLMWTPFNFTKSDREFLNGWDVYDSNEYKSFGFSGGGVTGFRKYLDKDLTIMVFTTGFKYYSVHNKAIDHIAGLVDKRLRNDQLALEEEILVTYFLAENPTSLESMYAEIKTANPDTNLESVFKSIGFLLFFQLERSEEAIELFKLNVNEYPESYDTYGSLGYLYFLTGQHEVARENYVKALELNPENSYSERRIKEIDAILEEQLQTE